MLGRSPVSLGFVPNGVVWVVSGDVAGLRRYGVLTPLLGPPSSQQHPHIPFGRGGGGGDAVHVVVVPRK